MIQPRNRSSFVDQINPFTNDVFQEAVMRGDCAIVSVLLKYGIYARRNYRNAQGLTALQQAVFDGNMRLAVKLLEAGADIEAKTANEWTALHIAAAVGEYEIICMLISNCADLLALTKNEELPIDLACNREIKVKLAQEMTRVGYSELAMWYMRKLAAREGAFYVVSADAVLDIACYSNEDYDSVSTLSRTQSLRRNSSSVQEHSSISKRSKRQRNDSSDIIHNSPDRVSSAGCSTKAETMTYLSCSSGYLSEVIFNPSTGEYTQVSKSSVTSVLVSPKHTLQPAPGDLRHSKSLLSVTEETDLAGVNQQRSSTLKRLPSSYMKSMDAQPTENLQRKPSKIELFIDYSMDADAEDDTSEDANKGLRSYSSPITIPYSEMQRSFKGPNTPSKSSLDSYPKSISSRESSTTRSSGVHDASSGQTSSQSVNSSKTNNEGIDRSLASTLASSEKQARNQSSSKQNSGQAGNLPYDSRAVMRNSSFKNVRFTGDIDANEFCNCPNCKKMGYALSPDLRDSQKRSRTDSESMPLSKSFPTSAAELNGYSYSQSSKQAYNPVGDFFGKGLVDQNFCGPGCEHWKPRKRKKNLLSGIINIFKDTIKIQRSTSETDITAQDSGIMFAVALRGKSKSTSIKQRNKVRRSNSFSGCSGDQQPSPPIARSKSFTTSDIVPPPPMFDADENHDADRGSYYVADTTYPVLPSTSQECPISIHEVNRSVRETLQMVHDSVGALSNGPTSASEHSNSSRSYLHGNGYENMRSLPYANYSDRKRASSGGYMSTLSPAHAVYADGHDTQSMVSDARISKLFSTDLSNAVHGELDHDCDFCAAFAVVQNRDAQTSVSKRTMKMSCSENCDPDKFFFS